MSPLLVITVIFCYFALLLGVSWAATRRGGGDSSTFFTGGRQAPWIAVSIATVGAAISGVTFISVPGMGAAKGYAYLQMALGFIVGYMLIAWVLVPMFYRRNLVSIYGYLGERFGARSYRSGAWLFFISKISGAAVRFMVVCAVLQLLVCDPLGIPFELNVIVAIALIWLYTARGGVSAVIWADVLKTFCLVMSVLLCIYFVSRNLGMSLGETASAVASHHTSRIFFFDDPLSANYFWKQFIAGIFMAIATNGLDQDMMQRALACRNSGESRKNMITGSIAQFFVIAMFLILGTVLVLYTERMGLEMPGKTDELFGMIATHHTMPVIVGVLFIIGLVAAAYSAAGSALTSLTTSFTVDILGGGGKGADERKTDRARRWVHVAMSVVMGLIIIAFYRLCDSDAISAVYTLASYTYGPILGLFAYGLAWRRHINDRLAPLACIAAPAASYGIARALYAIFAYETGFELLLINAAMTFIFLYLTSLTKKGNQL